MENNDLQKAIDEIANNASRSEEAGDLDQIQDQMGVPPMPPINGMEGNMMPDSDMNSLPTIDGVDAPAPESHSSVSGDLGQIRENALKELIPIMEKTQADPIQKYNLYRDAVLTLHDQGSVKGAYDAARQISDEAKRADALLDIVNIIDRM